MYWFDGARQGDSSSQDWQISGSGGSKLFMMKADPPLGQRVRNPFSELEEELEDEVPMMSLDEYPEITTDFAPTKHALPTKPCVKRHSRSARQ